MGNTVGSANTDFWNLKTKNDAYIVGLWCADGYHRTSSIGLSNTDTDLIEKFREFFLKFLPVERLKLRIYHPDKFKRRTKAYHLYVNSRPLLRIFKEFKNDAKQIGKDLILPYIAGRFDGDGSVAKDFYRDCRIVYGSREEAGNDLALMRLLGFQKMKIYYYRTAKTFCLYFSRLETNKFLSLIYPYSVRLQKSVFAPRRDLITTKVA
ncbi:MAG: hypothetical protein HYT03_03520 [Candidatus Harrisonbacteria bacterium]|nr:hypothetical protein [Candidatus Harrisonbacteria bacterium]